MSECTKSIDEIVKSRLSDVAYDLEIFVKSVVRTAPPRAQNDPLFEGAERIAGEMAQIKDLRNSDDAFMKIRQISSQIDRMLAAL